MNMSCGSHLRRGPAWREVAAVRRVGMYLVERKQGFPIESHCEIRKRVVFKQLIQKSK